LLQSIGADFKDLRDVSAATARAAELSKQPEIKRALAAERDNVEAEARLLDDFRTLEDGLRDPNGRRDSLDDLRLLLAGLSRQAGSSTESAERARARRVLRIVTMGAGERVQDQEYLNLLQQFRPEPGRRGGSQGGPGRGPPHIETHYRPPPPLCF